MQINWFTVIAQIINFLILVWLLKRYLYKPILDAIDEREARITAQLNDAEARKAEAKIEQEEFIQKNEAFDRQKQDRMNDVLAEAKEAKEKLIEVARSEADALRAKLEAAAREMQEHVQSEIARKTQEEVFAIVGKTLTDLASVSLEEQSTTVFISKLKELDEHQKIKFLEVFKAESIILVQSAFPLSKNSQDQIKMIVNVLVGAEVQFQFKTSPRLISGIELTTNGFKLAWSISEYLKSLESNIYKMIKEKSEVSVENNENAIT